MSEGLVGAAAHTVAGEGVAGRLRRQWPWLAALAVALIVPWLSFDWTTGRHSGFIVSMLSQMGIMIIFALSYNMQMGQSGLLSFGHAVFLGSAGYTSAYAAKMWGWPPELAIVTGTAVAAVLGVVIGALAIRSKGIYFANITLALAQMVYFFCVQAKFTGGEDGIQSVPRGVFLGLFDLRNIMTMYFVVLAIFLAGFLLLYRTIHSPFGQVL